ncbi:hypothetical protein J7I93_09140 [Bacillus sp. ISL-47]|uniref:hypothetical protein n=1 Tax=Bacillus sp. ISL-47 TaxID=2819130 RepID=UPI001BED1B7E|nr:hypothetical protein [Bacillus sp. ISL-47]MBT2688345.1 hypothetical protein [Bacillus sp. ISL-47]MBT2710544.1 hypothetical protein [Pseudomonas sp. ISL-84]
MDYINPLFDKPAITNSKKPIAKRPQKSHKQRSVRKDKTHNIKFPVSPLIQMKLKSFCKQAARIERQRGRESISQTKFNTILLRFALQHEEIINWTHEYSDTKVYMHTNILETEYTEVGGPHGLAIRKNLSERKVVYHMIHSVLTWMEGEGSLEKIL